MNQVTSEPATVDKCLSKESPEEQLCAGKNGLVNGLVHPKKNKRNKRQKAVEAHENSVEKDLPSDQPNSGIINCTNLAKGDNEENLDTTTKNGLENYQSHNLVNNVDSFKNNDEKQKPVNLDTNHKLSESNCDINITENNVTSSEILEDSLCCNSKENHASNDNISEISNDIWCLNLGDKCEESSCDQKIDFVQYQSELQMPMIMKIIQKDLSEPYSIYTYRYFIHNWPKLCFLAMCKDQCVGAIVCKLDVHRKVVRRGYIAMLAVDQNFRKLKIGSTLVQMAIHEMTLGDADEVVLETEVTNKPALKLYEKLGFVRDKRLFRYYLNGVDALRLKLWLR